MSILRRFYGHRSKLRTRVGEDKGNVMKRELFSFGSDFWCKKIILRKLVQRLKVFL